MKTEKLAWEKVLHPMFLYLDSLISLCLLGSHIDKD